MPKANGYAARDKEIERLRTAMVHAIDDLEQMATHPRSAVDVHATMLRVAGSLKKALVKK